MLPFTIVYNKGAIMAKELNTKQIEEIKNLLLENKEKIEQTLHTISDDHESLSSLELNDEADFASASRDYNNDVQIKNQQQRELNMINDSLHKIATGKFTGFCEMCDAEIGMPRLRVKPHAKYCIECRNIIDSGKTA